MGRHDLLAFEIPAFTVREKEMRAMLTRYVVVFGVAGKLDTWSANYSAESYGDAEAMALQTLASNDDRKSFILRIERW